MAGGNHHKPSSTKPSSSGAAAANHRKPHRETTTTTTTNNHHKPSPSTTKPSPSLKHKPSPNPNPNPNHEKFAPPLAPVPPPPPPAYGFHMLDRRTIVLADGTARSYFALPPDYRDYPAIPLRPPQGPEAWPGFDHNRQNEYLALESGRKRKFVGEERDEVVNDGFARQRQQLLQYGNSGASGAGSSSGGGKHMRFNEVDEKKVKSAFLNFVRVVNENGNQKRKYLADGKSGSVPCLACGNGRSSKDFPDMHSLIMHTYNPEKVTSDLVPDHLGLHKALCILMGWNYMMPPDNSKAYQRLPVEQAAADRDDLIMWPPHVIIHNTATGKGRDGRMEGLGNKAMETKLRDFGFTTGKSKAMYGRDGHMGTTVVKFASDLSGLKDAMSLADFFERQKHGRGSWASIHSIFRPGKDDEKDPNFVKLDKRTGEKERILYGYLGTVFDLEGVDFDTRKKILDSLKSQSQCTVEKGTTLVKFASDPPGLKDAMRLADFLEKPKQGRTFWASIQSMFRPGKDDEKDPNFVKVDKRTGEKGRILYRLILVFVGWAIGLCCKKESSIQ